MNEQLVTFRDRIGGHASDAGDRAAAVDRFPTRLMVI